MSNNEPTPAASGQPVTPGGASPGSQTGASSQLKVLQLCHDYQGPFQSICWQYNQAFEKHDVTTVYLKGPRSEEVIRRTGGNRVLFFEQPHLRGMKIRSILALARFFRKNRFNVVIAHRYKPIFLAGLMSYFFDIRLILGVAHEHDVFSRVARSLFVTFWRTNIFIVAVSDSVFRNIAQHCPSLVADKRLATLGHSLPEVELMDRETARQNLNLPEGFLFGCVGRLVAKKNHQLLIKAFARAGLGKDCFLVFFGTGPQAKELSDMTASSGMDNQVLFKGFVDWAARYYRAFDTFVFPSGGDEAYGVVLLEAMQAELPILASNAAGPCEVLGDVGIRFTMDDVDSLAVKLRLMVEHNERWRLDMGRASKRRFDSEFTISSFIGKFNNLPPIVQLTQCAHADFPSCHRIKTSKDAF